MSKCNPQFESQVVKSMNIKSVVMIGRIAVIRSEMEADIIFMERVVTQTNFRRNVESPIGNPTDERGHIDTL